MSADDYDAIESADLADMAIDELKDAIKPLLAALSRGDAMTRTYVDTGRNIQSQRVFVSGINQGMVLDEEPPPDEVIEAIEALPSSTVRRVVREVADRVRATLVRAPAWLIGPDPEAVLTEREIWDLFFAIPRVDRPATDEFTAMLEARGYVVAGVIDPPDNERARLFMDLNGRAPDNPPTWIELRRLAELDAHPHALMYLAHKFGIDISSGFEPSAQLRADGELISDDEGDDLGAETDATLMGEAESWFRERAGTEEST